MKVEIESTYDHKGSMTYIDGFVTAEDGSRLASWYAFKNEFDLFDFGYDEREDTTFLRLLGKEQIEFLDKQIMMAICTEELRIQDEWEKDHAETSAS